MVFTVVRLLNISNGLLPVETLAGLFAKHLTVTVRISDGDMYQVVGQRRL